MIEYNEYGILTAYNNVQLILKEAVGISDEVLVIDSLDPFNTTGIQNIGLGGGDFPFQLTIYDSTSNLNEIVEVISADVSGTDIHFNVSRDSDVSGIFNAGDICRVNVTADYINRFKSLTESIVEDLNFYTTNLFVFDNSSLTSNYAIDSTSSYEYKYVLYNSVDDSLSITNTAKKFEYLIDNNNDASSALESYFYEEYGFLIKQNGYPSSIHFEVINNEQELFGEGNDTFSSWGFINYNGNLIISHKHQHDQTGLISPTLTIINYAINDYTGEIPPLNIELSGNVRISGSLNLFGLVSEDPNELGQLWYDESGFLRRSAGS
jgi:hypothetical protein